MKAVLTRIMILTLAVLPLLTGTVTVMAQGAAGDASATTASLDTKDPGDQSAVDSGITPPAEAATDLNGADLNGDTVPVKGDSLFTTVKQGGPLMIFLVLLGIGALTIIIERLIFFTRNRVWKDDQLEIVLKEAAQESKSQYREDLEDDLRACFQIYANGVEKGLALLSGIGNIAPIIGFLGTVIGMIQAFASIAAATTVNAKVVAVGIQVALVTTAGGLIVAAPTLAFYYFFTHVIQNRTAKAEEVIGAACEGLPRLSDKLCQDM